MNKEKSVSRNWLEGNYMENRIIATAGKGGVGKTTISILMLKTFIQRGIEYILMVDADPA